MRPAALALSAVFVVAALFSPAVLRPLNRVWAALAKALSRITTPVICALLFYCVVTPVALLLRMRGKDSLRLRKDSTARTYWIERETPGAPFADSMRLQF